MTSIEDAFSSDSSSSSFSSLSALANNMPALTIDADTSVSDDANTCAAAISISDTAAATTTNTSLLQPSASASGGAGKRGSMLKVPRNKSTRPSIDSNFYADDINYGETENTSLADLKKFIIHRNLKAANPEIEFKEKLNKPILEFFDLATNSCRVNNLVIDYSKNNNDQVIQQKKTQK